MAIRIGGVSGLTLLVEAAFGYDPDDPAPVWTNITTYVRSFTTSRGRKREIDRVTAGQCSVLLDNRDRRFEGGYTGGAYGSNVVPMVPIRIRVTRNAVTYPVFYGFADEWVPSLDAHAPEVAVVALHATDAFKVLSLINAPQSVWGITVEAEGPLAWWRFADAPSTNWYESISGGYGFYTAAPTRGTALVPYGDGSSVQFSGANWAQSNDTALIPTAAPFTVEAWIKMPDTLDSAIILVQEVYGTARKWKLGVVGFGNPYLTFSYVYGFSAAVRTFFTPTVIAAGATYHVVLTLTAAGVAKIYLNGVAQSEVFGVVPTAPESSRTVVGRNIETGGTASPWKGSIDELVIYDTDESANAAALYAAATNPWSGDGTGARIGRYLDLAGWPAGLRDVNTGTSLLGPAALNSRSIIDLLWEVVEFEDGNLYVARDGDVTFRSRTARYADTTSTVSQATYSYTGANSKASGASFDYSDELLRNHAVISTPTGDIFEEEDATSIGRYLRRTHTQRIPQADPNHARALAQWIVQTRKTPQRRLTGLQVPTVRDTTTFDQTVNLDIGYRVTVTLDPPGTGTISEAVLVEGIDHNVTPHSWTTTLWCSPDPSPEVVIVGVSLVGGSEVVGY